MILALTPWQQKALYDLQALIGLAQADLADPDLSEAERLDSLRQHLNEMYGEVMEILGPMIKASEN